MYSKDDILSILSSKKEFIFDHAVKAEINTGFDPKFVYDADIQSIWNFLLPTHIGGNCQDADSLVSVWKECARLDGSFGWLSIAYVLAITHSAVHLPDEGFNEVFSDLSNIPLIAGQYQPNGRAISSNDGFNLTGNWAFGSGIADSKWAVCGFYQIKDQLLVKNNQGSPEVLIAVVPKSKISTYGDWNTTGLLGTNSINFSCENFKVNEQFFFNFDNPKALRGNSLHKIGILSISAASHGAWALGIAQSVLDELSIISRKNIRANEKKPLYKKDYFLLDYAKARARIGAAECYLVDSIKTASDAISRGDIITDDMHSEIRLAATFANEICVEIAEIAYKHIGTSAVTKNNRIERILRDISIGRQHMMISPNSYIEQAESWFEV